MGGGWGPCRPPRRCHCAHTCMRDKRTVAHALSRDLAGCGCHCHGGKVRSLIPPRPLIQKASFYCNRRPGEGVWFAAKLWPHIALHCIACGLASTERLTVAFSSSNNRIEWQDKTVVYNLDPQQPVKLTGILSRAR